MKVFISYTWEDRSLVERLSRYLADRGFSVSTASTITFGEIIAERISEEISSSDAVIILISKRYERSRWAEFELSMAVYQQVKGKVKHIVPVVTESGATLPPLLNGVLYINADDQNDDRVFSQILQSLRSSEKSSRHTTNQLKWLNDQAEALKLESILSPLKQTAYSAKLIVRVGSLLAVTGVALGLGLVVTIGRSHPTDLLRLIMDFVAPVLSAIAGYYFGASRAADSKSSQPVETSESGARE